MINIVVTGATGKSGLFFYDELRKNADQLRDYQFCFMVRNKEKAEKLLNANGLNQTLLVGNLEDKKYVETAFQSGGKNAPSHSQYWLFRAVG